MEHVVVVVGLFKYDNPDFGHRTVVVKDMFKGTLAVFRFSSKNVSVPAHSCGNGVASIAA